MLCEREQIMKAGALNPADGAGSGLGHENQQGQDGDRDDFPAATKFPSCLWSV
jgi:hypothetical protein